MPGQPFYCGVAVTLKERVHFLGYRNDIPDLLRAADIFVSASHREGMPRSIIEAMMCGLPVVATNIRGSREEVVQGETGILVGVKQPDELAQALDALASNPAARKKLGKAGRERALDLYDETKVVARQIKTLGLEKKLF
jgi:glycosyltransferase involved in cell wall biosynthesis